MEERLLQSEATYISNIKGQVWAESKKLWRISFPAIISRVSSFGIMVVTQAFIGRISELDLAAFSLTQTLTLRLATGILLGMSSATETLCGQAFGARQYHMLGIYLQRSWLINFMTATILLPLFIFTEQIFKLVGEEDTIATASGDISLWFIPTLYSYVFSYTIQQFLQAQLKNRIMGWLSGGTFLFHLLLSWIFVIKLNLGVPGAMGALSISSWILVIGEFVYVFGDCCSNTWKGFTTAAFTDLLPVLKLSISSGIMLCLELWYNSVLVLIAGYMTNAMVAISAFSICLSISVLEFMISLGFLIGASLSVLLAFTILLQGGYPVLSGVAVGSGRQSMVAYVNLGSYYVIGVPIGVLLAYVANLEVQGLWIGMMCGVVVQTAVLGYITWKTDWEGQVKKASERVNRWFLKPSDESEQSPNQAIAIE